jgi:riboflavin kinase/FMN adenylyltransferase
MKIHYGLENVGEIKNAVVTTGSFDGVHIGHKVIIRRLNILAAEIDGESVLITFWPHPRKVLYPDTKGKDLKMISSQKEKIRVLEETGLDHLLIIEFTKAFSQLSSEQFIMDVLVDKLHASRVIVGFNHYFGHNREGNFDFLREIGRKHQFEVEEIPEQDIQNESVSSTKIRKALVEGNVQRANAYLNHIYMIIGPIKDCGQPLKEMGIASYGLKIEEEEKLVPPPGIYAVNVEWDSEHIRGILFCLPSGEKKPLLCFKLFEQKKPPENKDLTVLFHKRIRGQEFFEKHSGDAKAYAQAMEETMELIY